VVVWVTVTLPRGVTPAFAMRNPFPLGRVHFIPCVMDRQVMEPRVTEYPYGRVGVPTPAFARQRSPVHDVSVDGAVSVADC
jgi:hypothetical protein